MADLRLLELSYPVGYRAIFEDMCTQMFCAFLGLSNGINRRVTQKCFECERVRVGDRVYAFMAKYYDPATRLSTRRDDFLRCIDAAREQGITDVLIFVNKDLPDIGTSGREPRFLKDIEDHARGGFDASEVRLDWWTCSRIETTLDMPGYAHVRKAYFDSGNEAQPTAFYEYAYHQFHGDNASVLLGSIPLSESYIEPTIEDGQGRLRGASEYIESWVDEKGSIAVLCGKPGHGKTSLCLKAVCDFYEFGWLADKVSNVFRFSLNLGQTMPFDCQHIDFYSLLSWGDERLRQEISAEHCRNALIFLDGFDELIQWLPMKLTEFISRYVVMFQREYEAHVVITTRDKAIDTTELSVWNAVPVLRMLPISKEQQLEWIVSSAEYYRRSQIDDSESVGRGSRKSLQQKSLELNAYLHSYRRLQEDEALQELLGIPLIFRIIVSLRYVPRGDAPLKNILDDLLYELVRDASIRTGSSMDSLSTVIEPLCRLALRMYLDDTITAVVSLSVMNPLLAALTYSCCTELQGERRCGFTHSVFYQYFLAREVSSWFVRYAHGGNEDGFRNSLSYLARKRLDEITLSFIRDMSVEGNMNEEFNGAFTKAYQILKETDGILPLPQDEDDAARVRSVTPLERGNNVFWNVVSICSVCGYEASTENVNAIALRLFDLSGCVLVNSKLTKAILDGADLRGANLDYANLDYASLGGANLEGTSLRGADIRGANLGWMNMGEENPYVSNLDGMKKDDEGHYETYPVAATAGGYRYKIGVSFTGGHRDAVRHVCNSLLDSGFAKARGDIFYDEWHQARLAEPNADVPLQRIYGEECHAVVVFLSKDYKDKHWAGDIEWRSIRDLINKSKANQICLLWADRLEEGESIREYIDRIDGLSSTRDIAADVSGMEPSQVAELICKWFKEHLETTKKGELISRQNYQAAVERVFDSLVDCKDALIAGDAGQNTKAISRLDDAMRELGKYQARSTL